MSYNPKLVKLQQNINLNELKNSDLNFIEKYISAENSIELNNNSRTPIYTPEQTLSMFVSQAINADGSCQNVVNKLALNRDKDICISTSAYCQARTRLSVVAITNITKEIARIDEERIDSKWKFRGRNVYLVDGTTITMADTVANQKAYPQPNFQKEGLGFPICRLVGSYTPLPFNLHFSTSTILGVK